MSDQVATFDVISDSKQIPLKQVVGVATSHQFDIGLHAKAILDKASVLSYMLRPVGPDNLEYKVEIINGGMVTTEIASYVILRDVWRVFQIVVNADVLTLTGNKLKFTLGTGTGTINLSDIVLLYKKTL